MLNPGDLGSTRKIAGFFGSPSTLAWRSTKLANSEPLAKHFWPLITYRFPRRTAAVLTFPASEPLCGSVMTYASLIFPRHEGIKYSFTCWAEASRRHRGGCPYQTP